MNPEEVLFYKIEAYLRGQLPPPEARAFEAEMAADPGLAALVRRQYVERQALDLLAERQLRADMNAWERTAPPDVVPVVSKARNGWSRTAGILRWAAAVLALAAAGWWIFQRQSPGESPDPAIVQTPPPLARPNTSPETKTPPRPPERKTPATPSREPAVGQPPERTTAAPSVSAPDYAALADEFYRERDFFPAPSKGGQSAAGYDRALRDFQDGHYSDVAPRLQPGKIADPKNLNVQELLAHAQLKNRQYDAAIAAFQEMANSRQQPYADRAEWALALTCLRQMPRRQALLNRTLNQILAKPNHAFYGKAKALRERLK